MTTVAIKNGYNTMMNIYTTKVTITKGACKMEWMKAGKDFAKIYAEAIKGVKMDNAKVVEEYWMNNNGTWTKVEKF